jgi:hypothetical protein
MGNHTIDRAMDGTKVGDQGRKTRPLYILTASVIWALVAYSLSPLSKPQPARLAARSVQPCEGAAR